MRFDSRIALALAGGVLVVAAACGGSISDPPRVQPIQSPLVGQWMLTTKMDTFVFVTGPSYVDCFNQGDYCGHPRTTVDGAYLGGMLKVQDSLGMKGVVASSVQAGGSLTQASCDSVDYYRYTGCMHVGEPVTASYVGEITGTPDSTTTKSLKVDIKQVIPGTTAGATMVALDATYAGDSIYGRFFWGELGHSPSYRGIFVLHRVK